MKKTIFTLCSIALLSACSDSETTSSNQATEVKSKLAADGWSETDYLEPTEEQKANQNKITTLSFDKYEHNFGKVFQGTDNKHIFVVKNTGSSPLVITEASASCGCTVPKKPEAPIEPGGTGEIEVVFSPKPSQSGVLSKTITIKANTDPVITTLKITADIVDRMM